MRVIRAGDYKVCLAKIHVNDVERAVQKIGGEFQIVSGQCWKHVTFATLLALRAFERGTNHARTVNGEILLRLAGTLQIADAIREYGVKNGENFVVTYGDMCEERLTTLLKELEVQELPLEECADENLKSLFEKAALVEAL